MLWPKKEGRSKTRGFPITRHFPLHDVNLYALADLKLKLQRSLARVFSRTGGTTMDITLHERDTGEHGTSTGGPNPQSAQKAIPIWRCDVIVVMLVSCNFLADLPLEIQGLIATSPRGRQLSGRHKTFLS